MKLGIRTKEGMWHEPTVSFTSRNGRAESVRHCFKRGHIWKLPKLLIAFCGLLGLGAFYAEVQEHE